MKLLILNAGSSSLKFQFMNLETEEVFAKGVVERIGEKEGGYSFEAVGQDKISETLRVANHTDAVKIVVDALTAGDNPVVSDLAEIEGIGQRVLHGGTKIDQSVIVDDEVVKEIDKAREFAPLHNPGALASIEACREILPETKQVAVFDISFHASLDETHYTYGLNKEDTDTYGVRRYGYHGTSHMYVSQRCAELMGKDPEDLRIITCHLGNGSSITAVKGGKSYDTSMGFTALEGVLMGTRVGNIDAAAVLYLMDKKGLNATEMEEYLNNDCGILGVSGVSNDFRDIEAAMDDGDEQAQLAFDMFILSVKKYIGMYLAEMNGTDAIVFTAGIGENDDRVREAICADMDFLGLAIDLEKNKGNREESEITAEGAKIRSFIIPTNEELAIAQEVGRLLK